jgi:hypothetical protein
MWDAGITNGGMTMKRKIFALVGAAVVSAVVAGACGGSGTPTDPMMPGNDGMPMQVHAVDSAAVVVR